MILVNCKFLDGRTRLFDGKDDATAADLLRAVAVGKHDDSVENWSLVVNARRIAHDVVLNTLRPPLSSMCCVHVVRHLVERGAQPHGRADETKTKT